MKRISFRIPPLLSYRRYIILQVTRVYENNHNNNTYYFSLQAYWLDLWM